MEDCITTLVRGSFSVLEEVSSQLAFHFGHHEDFPSDADLVIGNRIVQQYLAHQDVFDRCMWTTDPKAALSQVAHGRGMLPSVFVYDISPYMAQAFRVGSNPSGELANIIRADGIEPEVISALQRVSGTRISASNLESRITGDGASFDFAHSLCRKLLSTEHAYSLLLAGVAPELIRGRIQNSTHVMSCIILGVDPTYAVKTRGAIDPRVVAKAYHDGVAIEYLLA